MRAVYDYVHSFKEIMRLTEYGSPYETRPLYQIYRRSFSSSFGLEDLMQALSDFLLDSGFNDPYSPVSESSTTRPSKIFAMLSSRLLSRARFLMKKHRRSIDSS